METSPILYNERRIFRCMIDNPRLGYELDSKWFSCTPARVVYETILYLYEHKVEITPANVATKADDERLYSFIENDVMKIDYKPEEFTFYSDNLRMAFVKRDINEHVLDDLKILTSSKGDLKFDKLEELYQLLSVDIDLAKGKNQTLPTFSQVANRYRGKLVQRKLGETYPFGSSLLDKALNSGAEPGRISTIFGASGMGKSTFAINLFSWEINRGIPTMYVTLEMDETATMDRLIALRTRTPLRVLKMKKTYNEEGDISVEVENVTAMQIQVCGISDALGKISSCYNTGDITVNTVGDEASTITSLSVGGITGANLYNTIEYCYNTGKISSNVENAKIGSIIGSDNSEMIYIKNYYLEGDGNTAIGAASEGEASSEELISASTEQFQDGTVAYELRKAGAKYGQKLNAPDSESSPVLLVFKENEGKEVYKRTLDYSKYEGNATEATELEDYVNSGNLWLPELNENEGWYDAEGNLYTNESTLSPDIFEITLYAEAKTPHTITISEMEGGKVEANKTTAIKGETITLTVTPNEGYNYIDKSLTVKAGEETITVTPAGNGTYTFIMPDANVTVSATFAEKLYTVTIEDCVGGTATIDGESSKQFAAKATVALSIKADEGYKFSHIVYTYDGENKTSEQTTFPMPASDVTVKVFFVAGDDEEGDGAGTTLKRYRLYLADQDFYLNDEYDEAGLVLYSRHDKKYTDVGGSFTVWFEKHGEVNEGARVFISNRANGEYKEVKLDKVSGYYQIRNVQSNIYVKLYTEEGFPVANEAIEATEARAYAQANKIVVITPEPTEVQIISMAGAVAATAQVAGQQEFANLTEGVYIVRMGESVVKLQVRN